jgi:hypothetical protein
MALNQSQSFTQWDTVLEPGRSYLPANDPTLRIHVVQNDCEVEYELKRKSSRGISKVAVVKYNPRTDVIKVLDCDDVEIGVLGGPVHRKPGLTIKAIKSALVAFDMNA